MKKKYALRECFGEMESYVDGAREALNYRGFDDFMVYYTLLAMGVPTSDIDHIGRTEREKREELSGIKRNKTYI